MALSPKNVTPHAGRCPTDADLPKLLGGMAVDRILLVEDDAAARGWLHEQLRALPDTKVFTCGGVADALLWLDQHTPDIVLTDLGLPDGSGLEVITKTRALHPLSEVLVVTVFGDETHVLAAIEAGAGGYLLKDSGLNALGHHLQDLRSGGSPLSPRIARMLIQRHRESPAPEALPAATPGAAGTLTPRELEVLTGIAKGFSYAELAELLSVSTNTVRTYIKRIYQRLSVNSRSEAVYEYNQILAAQGRPPLS
jgi:DNA-binding NarL/FixJ family response regulator